MPAEEATKQATSQRSWEDGASPPRPAGLATRCSGCGQASDLGASRLEPTGRGLWGSVHAGPSSKFQPKVSAEKF